MVYRYQSFGTVGTADSFELEKKKKKKRMKMLNLRKSCDFCHFFERNAFIPAPSPERSNFYTPDRESYTLFTKSVNQSILP